MMRRLSVLLVLGSVQFAGAQETTLLIPSDREASAQVARIVASAETAGLPTSSIVSKVRYGVSVMRANPDSIVAAAGRVASRLEMARVALAPNPTRPDIEAGANALAESATMDALRAVRRASGNRPVAAALGVLTQLLTNKVPVSKATEIVTDLIRRGATPNQLVALGNDVAGDVASGTQAQAAADLRAQGLIAVLAQPGSTVPAFAVDAPSSITGSSTKPPPPPKPPRRP